MKGLITLTTFAKEEEGEKRKHLDDRRVNKTPRTTSLKSALKKERKKKALADPLTHGTSAVFSPLPSSIVNPEVPSPYNQNVPVKKKR